MNKTNCFRYSFFLIFLLLLNSYTSRIQAIDRPGPNLRRAFLIGVFRGGCYWAAPFFHAAATNDVSKIQDFLNKQRAVINISDTASKTALMIAAENGHTAAIETLCTNGANLNATTREGKTALMFAAENGHTAAIETLCTKGANLHATTREGKTALMIAAENGHTAAIETLCTKGANPFATTNKGKTALMIAAENGHTAAIETLCTKGATATPELLITINHPDSLKTLLNYVKNEISTHGEYPGYNALHVGALKNQIEKVEVLLSKCDIDYKTAYRTTWDSIDVTKTALMLAAQAGHSTMVKLLLDRGASVDTPDKRGTTALMLAAQAGDEAIVQLLLDSDASVDTPNKRGETALMLAATQRNLYEKKPILQQKILEKLLIKGANIDAQDSQGQTSLIKIIKKEEEKEEEEEEIIRFYPKPASLKVVIINFLLEQGAKAEIRDLTGKNAIDYAIEILDSSSNSLLESELIKMVKAGNIQQTMRILERLKKAVKPQAFVAQKNYINHTDATGNSLLMLAAKNGHLALVKELIKMDASVNMQNNKNKTALMLALKAHKDNQDKTNLEIIAALLAHPDINVNLRDNDHHDTLHYATSRGLLDIVQNFAKKPVTEIEKVLSLLRPVPGIPEVRAQTPDSLRKVQTTVIRKDVATGTNKIPSSAHASEIIEQQEEQQPPAIRRSPKNSMQKIRFAVMISAAMASIIHSLKSKKNRRLAGTALTQLFKKNTQSLTPKEQKIIKSLQRTYGISGAVLTAAAVSALLAR